MSCYDMLPEGSQVKLWECEFNTKKVGDEVDFQNISHVVLLKEGGFVRVTSGVITEIVEDRVARFPEDFVGWRCVDKWGGEVTKREDLIGSGMFGYDYHTCNWSKDKS